MRRPLFSAMWLAVSLVTGVAGQTLLQAQGAPRQADGPLLLTLEGRGVQVYRCSTVDASPAWVLDHPEADLLDANGKVVGHHDAGPSWALRDGSRITGTLIEKTSSSEAGDIAALWLRVASHAGKGLLASAVTVRRSNAHGGVAPAQGCDGGMVGATVRVPYTASYTFYGKP